MSVHRRTYRVCESIHQGRDFVEENRCGAMAVQLFPPYKKILFRVRVSIFLTIKDGVK